MELIWVAWFVFGLIVGVLIGVDKAERNRDRDLDSDNPSTNRECGCVGRYCKGDDGK